MAPLISFPKSSASPLRLKATGYESVSVWHVFPGRLLLLSPGIPFLKPVLRFKLQSSQSIPITDQKIYF